MRQQKKLVYLFILLATAGEIAVTAIYTTGIGGRIDGLTYGRYNEQILPILMVLGCIGVMESRHIVKPALSIAILQLPVLGLIIYIIDKYHQTNIHAYMILGISYLYNGENFNPTIFHIMAYIVSIILMIFVIFILRISNSRKLPVLVAIIMAMELFLGIHLAQHSHQQHRWQTSGICSWLILQRKKWNIMTDLYISRKETDVWQIIYISPTQYEDLFNLR